MSNPIYEALELAPLKHDISERQAIIDQFRKTGLLDRNDAISKIKKLRMTDKEVFQIAVVEVSPFVPTIPLAQCSNEQLVNELEIQKAVLESKLVEKLRGNINKDKYCCLKKLRFSNILIGKRSFFIAEMLILLGFVN